jgi:hypothetical protein
MNVAFPALLIFILVLPGILLRYTYGRGVWRWLSPTSTTGLADEIAYSVTFAIVLHLLWSLLARLIFKVQVDFQSVLVLLTGSYGPDNELFEPTVASIAGHPFAVITYLLSLYAFAAGLGYGAHKVVREQKLDRKTRLLRFRNEWYYLLSGEVLEWREFAEARQAAGAPPINFEEDIDGVYLTAVVDLAEGSFLYRGVVRSFWFDKTGNLDRILLELAHRRRLSADKEESSNDTAGPLSLRYYRIDGDYFILRYSETKTINLDYFSLEG